MQYDLSRQANEEPHAHATIARANRRAPGKSAGVIVDYVGVFQNLQKALAIYAAKQSDSAPIRDKDDLVAELEKAVAEARAFCTTVGVEVDAIFAAETLARLTLISQAVEALVLPDEPHHDRLAAKAAQPIPPAARSRFYEKVDRALCGEGELGAGLVARTARAFSATSSSRSPTPRPWSTAGARRAPAADVEQPRPAPSPRSAYRRRSR